MDAPTFISDLVASLAWPLAVVVVAALLRPAILSLLGDLRTLRFRGVEFVFGEELARVRGIADEAELSRVPLIEGLPDRQKDNLLQLAEISPRSAIIEAWGPLEAQARSIAEAWSSRSVERPMTAAAVGGILTDAGVFDPERSQVYYMLRDLRNQAVHDPQLRISTDEAIEFANLARGLAHSLEEDQRGHENESESG